MHKNGTGVAKDLARAGPLFKESCDGALRQGLLRAGDGPLLGPRRRPGHRAGGHAVPGGLQPRRHAGLRQPGDDVRGRGQVAKDPVRAFKLFKEACDGGDIGGCARLAPMYEQAEGTRVTWLGP